MATYSSNTTVKISDAVQAFASGGLSCNYSAPSNGYAIVHVYLSGTGPSVTIGGTLVSVSGGTFYVGPSKTIVAVATVSCAIVGVEFRNSP